MRLDWVLFCFEDRSDSVETRLSTDLKRLLSDKLVEALDSKAQRQKRKCNSARFVMVTKASILGRTRSWIKDRGTIQRTISKTFGRNQMYYGYH